MTMEMTTLHRTSPLAWHCTLSTLTSTFTESAHHERAQSCSLYNSSTPTLAQVRALSALHPHVIHVCDLFTLVLSALYFQAFLLSFFSSTFVHHSDEQQTELNKKFMENLRYSATNRAEGAPMLAEHLCSTLLSACVSVCTFAPSQCLLTCVDTVMMWVTLFSWLKTQKQGKEFPASSTLTTVSFCLACSGLHARRTDAFNGSYLFPSRHEQCVLVRSRSAVDSLLCQCLVVALDTARSGEVLCFVCNNGDQDWTLLVQRISNLDTGLKGTQPSG